PRPREAREATGPVPAPGAASLRGLVVGAAGSARYERHRCGAPGASLGRRSRTTDSARPCLHPQVDGGERRCSARGRGRAGYPVDCVGDPGLCRRGSPATQRRLPISRLDATARRQLSLLAPLRGHSGRRYCTGASGSRAKVVPFALDFRYFAFRGIERSPGSSSPCGDRPRAAARLWDRRGDPGAHRRRARASGGHRLSRALPARGGRTARELMDDGRATPAPCVPADQARPKATRARAGRVEDVCRRHGSGDGVIELYLADLARQLRARGVRGKAAARVLAEARDHLLELEQAHGAIDRFGPSEHIAREVAARLATTRTFRATYAAFAALALTAAAYVLFFASINRGSGSPDLFAARHEAVGVAATLGLVLFPQ